MGSTKAGAARVEARFFEGSSEAKIVFVELNDGTLIGRLRESGQRCFSWPASSLVQSESTEGAIILRCPPKNERLEIPGDGRIQNVSWKSSLPDFQHKSSPWKGTLWAGGCVVVGLLFLISLPIIAKRIPWSVEKTLFKSFEPYQESDYCGEFPRGAGRAALDQLVSKLYPLDEEDTHFPLEVHVVHGKEINAFAVPGGKIFVIETLLEQAESSDEIAGILAHEIEHVKQRHVMQQVLEHSLLSIGFDIVFSSGTESSGKLLEIFMQAQYTKNQEKAADEGALKRLQKAKISSGGIINFFRRMETLSNIPSILSDHPSDESRIALFRQNAELLLPNPLSDTEWGALKTICGKSSS